MKMATYKKLYEKRENEEMLDKLCDILTQDSLELGNLLDDMARAETDEVELKDYLKLLMRRFTLAPLKVNEVRVNKNAKGEVLDYCIYNYTYSMYKWFLSHGWDTVFARPHYLMISNEWLNDKERKNLNEKITQH